MWYSGICIALLHARNIQQTLLEIVDIIRQIQDDIIFFTYIDEDDDNNKHT